MVKSTASGPQSRCTHSTSFKACLTLVAIVLTFAFAHAEALEKPGAFTINDSKPYCVDKGNSAPAVRLAWKSSDGANSYVVYRDRKAISKTLPRGERSYIDNDVREGSTYSYSIEAENSKGTTRTPSERVQISLKLCRNDKPPGKVLAPPPPAPSPSGLPSSNSNHGTQAQSSQLVTPSITEFVPSRLPVATNAQSVTINGRGFDSSTTVEWMYGVGPGANEWRAPRLGHQLISPTQIRLNVQTGTDPDRMRVRVVNRSGNVTTTSNIASFDIVRAPISGSPPPATNATLPPPVASPAPGGTPPSASTNHQPQAQSSQPVTPSIVELVPLRVPIATNAQSITLSGRGFESSSTVEWMYGVGHGANEWRTPLLGYQVVNSTQIRVNVQTGTDPDRMRVRVVNRRGNVTATSNVVSFEIVRAPTSGPPPSPATIAPESHIASPAPSSPVISATPQGNTSWAGQPLPKPINATKGYFVADYFRNASTEPYTTITLTGTGFGTAGAGQVLVSDSRLFAEILTWSDTKISFVLRTKSWAYEYNSSVTFAVKTANGVVSAPSASRGVAGMIQTRPWGQCTWEVAKTRLDKNLSIPPSAYAGTRIDKDWVPARWDAITFESPPGSGQGHVGIISSVQALPEEVFSAPDKLGHRAIKSRKYRFTVSDRNRGWNEAPDTAEVSVTIQYGVDEKPTSIDLSEFKVAYPAYRFFR